MTTNTEIIPDDSTRMVKVYPRAPWELRIMAFLVDILIAWLPLTVLSLLFFLMIPWFMGYEPLPFLEGVPRVFFFVTFAGFIISFLWFCFYSLARDGLGSGQSLGKYICQLMVVHTPTDQPCNIWRAIYRKLPAALITVVASPLYVFGIIFQLVEPIAALINDKGLRLGDQLADTQVIEKKLYQDQT